MSIEVYYENITMYLAYRDRLGIFRTRASRRYFVLDRQSVHLLGIALVILYLATATLSCSSIGTSPDAVTKRFSLRIVVTDSLRAGVQGLRVSFWNIVPEFVSQLPTQPIQISGASLHSTKLIFTAASAGYYRLNLLNLNDQLVQPAMEGNVTPGYHGLSLTIPELHRPLYKATLAISDSNHIVGRSHHAIYLATNASGNLDLTAVGFTDMTGTVYVTDSGLFPCLYTLPALSSTNVLSPNPTGTFHYSSDVVVVVSDTATGLAVFDSITIANGQTIIDSVVWGSQTKPESLGARASTVNGDSIHLRGDLNCNGVQYEAADAYVYRDYFTGGLATFDSVQCSIDGSDIDGDGITLTLADFVYLIRILHSESQPFPKTAVQFLPSLDVAIYDTLSGCVIRSLTDISVAGFFAVARGSTTPSLFDSNMEIAHHFDGVSTRVLVYSPIANTDSTHAFGPGPFLYLEGVRSRDVLALEAASQLGKTLLPRGLPAIDSLYQNFPNPF